MKKRTLSLAIALAVSVSGCSLMSTSNAPKSAEQAVVENYANLAYATFDDAYLTALDLQNAVDMFLAQPSAAGLDELRNKWKTARIPYQQSEVFRFGNAVVDDWEGQLNAWPLDEGLIDYVSADYYQHELGNPGSELNIIANQNVQFGSETLSLTEITAEKLASLNELGGSEANVATGYHAIEFLLWGQDLNGSNKGAGERPYTDYLQGADCTGGNCSRRGQYLKAAVELLVSDLDWMRQQWAEGGDNYRKTLLSEPAEQGLRKMLYGMGSLSLGELAGERIKVALEANSTEDEHDCFSDNTHYSHYYDAKGIQNIYLGQYKRMDGSLVSGASLSDLVAAQNSSLDLQVRNHFDNTDKALQAIVDLAEGPRQIKFDMMIAADNEEGQALLNQSILALVEQTRAIEQVAESLKVDALNPDTADHEF
ncbi:putative iron-regulated protein [Oceanospirillum multiglobuliferum]|uniref:Peptidase n=1 Tax=Oceanospirillum multiglobuliferum TaxID=64969 RepID=A0A1T4PGV0_9GAMM|nr:imelysin family protein [Oceanospirillum multiglobuliferum]OPX55550.1 peptidase [Oceanospirillum multiglobuliferum]SJZ90742.1 putative iron-regulated protein [Oceanospirillum multiglobuliferum]